MESSQSTPGFNFGGKISGPDLFTSSLRISRNRPKRARPTVEQVARAFAFKQRIKGRTFRRRNTVSHFYQSVNYLRRVQDAHLYGTAGQVGMEQVLAALVRIENLLDEGLTNIDERLERIEGRLDRSMSREFRLNSTHCGSEVHIHWIPAARGPLPDGRPALQRQLKDMDLEMCQALEQAYGLVPEEGADIVARRATISSFLGVVYD